MGKESGMVLKTLKVGEESGMVLKTILTGTKGVGRGEWYDSGDYIDWN